MNSIMLLPSGGDEGIAIFVRSPAEVARATAAAQAASVLYRLLDERVDTAFGHVSISTMRLAKEFAFRAVAVMACDDEVVPLQARIETIADEADLEEVYTTERHLLYVACTRALHAKTRAGARDDEARARLLRYVLRPPLSQERLAILPDHRLRLTLKRPWSDGTYALEMDALALLARLASAAPPPRQHQTRYAGVLSAAAHWRPLIIPPEPSALSASEATPPPPTTKPAHGKPGKPRPSGNRCRYIRWATLLRLTFGLTVDKCPACRGDMRMITDRSCARTCTTQAPSLLMWTCNPPK